VDFLDDSFETLVDCLVGKVRDLCFESC
jgi:hypothetical protein